MKRLEANVELLCRYEAIGCHLLLVNDSDDRGRFQPIIEKAAFPVHVVDDPMWGKVGNVRSRLRYMTLLGLEWAYRQVHPAFVLKIDTDALIVAPFSSKIQEFFDHHSNVGVVGSYKRYPTGERVIDEGWIKQISQMKRLFWTYWRQEYSPAFRQALWGDGAYARRWVKRALCRGYESGEHCQGGAYAVSHSCLELMHREQVFENKGKWTDIRIPSDMMVGIVARGLDMEMADLNFPGQPFAVQYKGLPYSPPNIVERGYSIIHSIENDPDYTEDEIIKFFLNRE
jgi:hypothetical protein